MNPFVLLEIVFWKRTHFQKRGKKKNSRKLNHFLVLASDPENELELGKRFMVFVMCRKSVTFLVIQTII